MKNTNIRFISLFVTVLWVMIAITTNAQKLPNVQKTSVRAPVNIKIDGKATEWNNKFHAYNHATDIYYTLSNDDNKLYLTVQAENQTVIQKILLGGITLVINPSVKKDDKNGVAITFPMFDKKDRPNINLMSKPVPTKNKAINKMQLDSFMRATNTKLTDKLKEIEITGVKALPDSMLSIYNDIGIKAAALFDNQISYTYELAVPLKYLGLLTDKFLYHIELNGAATNHATIQLNRSGSQYVISGGGGPSYVILNTPQFAGMVFPTDFWGEYTLAKK